MKRNQTMRRGLSVLLALVLCLSLLPATALADGVKTMTTGGIVAENQPFQVYLGDKPVSTVIVKYPINGGVQSFHWPNEAHRQDVQIQGKYLTVGGKYVSAGGNDSLVGLTLTGVEFDYLEIKYENGTRSGNFLVRWDSETNEYISKIAITSWTPRGKKPWSRMDPQDLSVSEVAAAVRLRIRGQGKHRIVPPGYGIRASSEGARSVRLQRRGYPHQRNPQ